MVCCTAAAVNTPGGEGATQGTPSRTRQLQLAPVTIVAAYTAARVQNFAPTAPNVQADGHWRDGLNFVHNCAPENGTAG